MNFYEDLEKYKDNAAFILPDNTRYTYAQVMERIDELASNIASNEKRLIFVLCNNNLESITGYLTALRKGHVAFLISHDIDRMLLNQLIEKYRPDYVWGETELESKEVYQSGKYKLYHFDIKRNIKIYDKLNLLLSTSGSTGSSKLVKLTGANLNANAKSIANYLKIDQKERPITVLPMNYSYGLSVINSHLLMGCTILLTNYGIMQKEFWKFLDAYQPTSLCGVPYTYEMYQKLRITKMDLPSVKTFTQAGGKISPVIAKEFVDYAQKTDRHFFIMYGQTEATARISYLPYEYGASKAGSIGIAIPDGKLYLVKENGEVIKEPNVVGQMVYEGKNVMLGYALQESDLAIGDENKGVLKTGDLGYFDQDNFYFITGRMGRNIKICGNRINLDEVEKILQSLGYNCYVGGEDELIKIVLQDDRQEEIKKAVQTKIHVHPSQIQFIKLKEIPRNEYGKVSYAKMFQ